MRIFRLILIISSVLYLASCAGYKQNIMFKTDDYDSLLAPVWEESRYKIEPFDQLELNVFTGNGEILIDPNLELVDRNVQNTEELRPQLVYTVDNDGVVLFPMVGKVELAGKTLTDAEATLQDLYAKYYKDPFVKLNYLNKRVILLGGFGSKVIPLLNENMTVAEVLALSERDDDNIKAKNFRLIRGEDTYQLDFSTIQGYQYSKMRVFPGDILYVEPVKRPFSEFLKENGALITVFSSLATLIAVIVSIK